MRGDSLRDLYAKTLAVIGFGLLASVAAVVDYWPARPDPPKVLRARLPAGRPAAVLGIAALPNDVPVLFASRAEPPAPAVPAIPSLDASIPVVQTADLGFDAHHESLTVVPFPEGDIATGVELRAPLLSDPIPMAAPAVASAVDQSWTGTVTGAFAKTGTTIVRTGSTSLAKTASSIADVVRMAGGMFNGVLKKMF